MSWQKRSIQLILGLPISLPIVAYAVNIGDTYVQSQQNQPLKASINVSDIDPATFSVKLANEAAYQQLGLSNDTKLNVKFQPTSSNGGQIVITSAKPLNAPFTDIVLNITNKGETKTLPKTLLLPIDAKKQVITQSNTELVQTPPKTVNVGTSTPLNLPVIEEPTPVIVNEPVASQPVAQATNTLPITPSGEPTLKGSLDPSKTLIISETRRPATGDSQAPNAQVPNAQITLAPSNAMVTAADRPSAQPVIPKHIKTKPASQPTYANTADVTSTEETVTYIIQRNDNLWTIANQLAKQNKTDVNQVMKDIVSANPNAFENNDPTKLVANTELQLPKYKVMPSQLGIKSANSIKKQTHHTVTKKTTPKKSTTQRATTAKHPSNITKKPMITRQVKPASKPITKQNVTRQAEMKIIAPSQNNGSNQGTVAADKNLSKNSHSSQIVAQVQQKRQATAKQASKVNALNQSLVNAEQRLKLQNQKLAQLEQRLKELHKK